MITRFAAARPRRAGRMRVLRSPGRRLRSESVARPGGTTARPNLNRRMVWVVLRHAPSRQAVVRALASSRDLQTR